ncbi:MAG: heavy metal translocating P-type ATPase [Desulfovibrionaceae bacterium]|nr:heavy metal translocating P-type ATPase [Desulfovibrionaceae bacterium]
MLRKETWTVTGMTCSACSSRVEKTVASLPGMRSASVNLLLGCMRLEYDNNQLQPSAIQKAVEDIGYGASSGEQQAPRHRSRVAGQQEESGRLKHRFLASLFFLIPLFCLAMHHEILTWLGISAPKWFTDIFHGSENAVTFALTQFLLLIPIMMLNRHFYTSGFRTLLKGGPNMDSLIAVGSGSAVLYGIFVMYRLSWALGHGDGEILDRYAMDMYFESAGMILTLITFGKWLESRSKARTGTALASLAALAPDTAHIERNGEEQELPVSEVLPGDIVLVRPGDRIPVDGSVEEGFSAVDESFLTGESMPAEKSPGDAVTAASISRTGFLRIRAVRVGEDMAIRRIIRLVEEAGAAKAPIARLADRVAGIFVPSVIAISALTFAGWLLAGSTLEFALSCSISVLVISCPCALGLATPVAVMVGTGRGAELGILFKSGEALERLSTVDTFVLDKTGTVTAGRPILTDIIPLDPNLKPDDLARLAAGIEHGSSHPLAEALTEYAVSRNLKPASASEFALIPGRGVSAVIDGRTFRAGNALLMHDSGISLTPESDALSQQIANRGGTPLFIADEKRLIGLLAAADPVRPDSSSAVAALRDLGIRTVMLTGDNSRTAEAVRIEAGIPEVISQCLPEEKAQHITEMQTHGHAVAMVGDGINDAPALVQADSGVAIGAGTDIAIDSADVVLIKSRLTDAVEAFRLARAVLRNIRENLFWAFFYNACGIPLAAGLLYPLFGLKLNPMFAAAAMSLSSVCVVSNALRLRFFRPANPASIALQEPPTAAHDPVPVPARHNPGATCVHSFRLHIQGMMCSHCRARVAKALTDCGTQAEVNLEQGTATVSCFDSVTLDTLIQAVENAGYTVTSTEALGREKESA